MEMGKREVFKLKIDGEVTIWSEGDKKGKSENGLGVRLGGVGRGGNQS